MTINTSRRTVVRGAAWSAPAVTIATAAPAFAATPACLPASNPVVWQTINITVYSRVRTLVTSPVTNRTDAMSKVDYTLILPRYALAGATSITQPVVYQSTLTEAASNAAYSAGGRTVKSGYVDVTYNFGGGTTATTTPVRMNLNPGNVSMPSSGRLSTRFTGTMPAHTFTATAGDYAIRFQNPPSEPVESNASTYNGSQTVVTSFFGIEATARVHSMIPDPIPASLGNDWGTAGQAQSLNIGTLTVVGTAC